MRKPLQIITVLALLELLTVHCCKDVTGWRDNGGFGCDWYSSSSDGSRCREWGNCCHDNGHTAVTACCACGGGTDYEGCRDKRSTSGGRWKDADGNTCEWFAGIDVFDYLGQWETRCRYYGDDNEIDGEVAQTACCVCGGGERSPTKSPTRDPAREPTRDPTREPTRDPTRDPTRKPTKEPTKSPTLEPSSVPTANVWCGNHNAVGCSACLIGSLLDQPYLWCRGECEWEASINRCVAVVPSSVPSAFPSHIPSVSIKPTVFPSVTPSNDPTSSISPTEVPSDNPSISEYPTTSPSKSPSSKPTYITPSASPSFITSWPSLSPTKTHSPTETIYVIKMPLFELQMVIEGMSPNVDTTYQVTHKFLSEFISNEAPRKNSFRSLNLDVNYAGTTTKSFAVFKFNGSVSFYGLPVPSIDDLEMNLMLAFGGDIQKEFINRLYNASKDKESPTTVIAVGLIIYDTIDPEMPLSNKIEADLLPSTSKSRVIIGTLATALGLMALTLLFLFTSSRRAMGRGILYNISSGISGIFQRLNLLMLSKKKEKKQRNSKNLEKTGKQISRDDEIFSNDGGSSEYSIVVDSSAGTPVLSNRHNGIMNQLNEVSNSVSGERLSLDDSSVSGGAAGGTMSLNVLNVQGLKV